MVRVPCLSQQFAHCRSFTAKPRAYSNHSRVYRPRRTPRPRPVPHSYPATVSLLFSYLPVQDGGWDELPPISPERRLPHSVFQEPL